MLCKYRKYLRSLTSYEHLNLVFDWPLHFWTQNWLENKLHEHFSQSRTQHFFSIEKRKMLLTLLLLDWNSVWQFFWVVWNFVLQMAALSYIALSSCNEHQFFFSEYFSINIQSFEQNTAISLQQIAMSKCRELHFFGSILSIKISFEKKNLLHSQNSSPSAHARP